jgi:hypothetical protein
MVSKKAKQGYSMPGDDKLDPRVEQLLALIEEARRAKKQAKQTASATCSNQAHRL